MTEKLDSLGRRRNPIQAVTQFQPLSAAEVTVKIEVKMPASLRDAVDVAAAAVGLSRSEFVRTALHEAVG